MNARSRRVVVLRLTAAFAVSLLAALVAASWWIHEQQETLWKSFDEVEPKTVERIADALYGHLVVGSLVTFVVGVVLAYALASVAIAPVERMRRRELRMLAEAGHELRTPLTTIALEAELALEQQPSAEVAEALRSIVNEARALAHVADEVLELGRGEQAHLEVEPVRLDELAAERVERARRRHELGDDALRVDAPAAVTATANRHAAARAIDNLLDNAARHGTAPVVVTVRTAGAHAVVDVVDAGSGLDPDRVEALFAPFARADEARSRPGSGLGLGIVRSIARSLDGDASLEVLADGRTRARLQLPATER